MQFLSDVFVPCAECAGARFQPGILEVRFRGRSIREVLELTIAEAAVVFADGAEVGERLQPLAASGSATSGSGSRSRRSRAARRSA